MDPHIARKCTWDKQSIGLGQKHTQRKCKRHLTNFWKSPILKRATESKSECFYRGSTVILMATTTKHAERESLTLYLFCQKYELIVYVYMSEPDLFKLCSGSTVDLTEICWYKTAWSDLTIAICLLLTVILEIEYYLLTVKKDHVNTV